MSFIPPYTLLPYSEVLFAPPAQPSNWTTTLYQVSTIDYRKYSKISYTCAGLLPHPLPEDAIFNVVFLLKISPAKSLVTEFGYQSLPCFILSPEIVGKLTLSFR